MRSFIFTLATLVSAHAWSAHSLGGMGSRFGAAGSRPGLSTHLSASDGASDTTVVFSEIIGAGRIGELFAKAGECRVLGREDKIDPDGSGPILIATRNDSLDGIVDGCPEKRKKDLVFVQNGYLDNFLESKGLLDNTQVLLYLSVTAKGVDAVDGVTTVNPEGLTAAVGVHAQAFADRLASMDLKCNVVTPIEYRPAMFEKLMYVFFSFVRHVFGTHSVAQLDLDIHAGWHRKGVQVGRPGGC